MSERKKHPLDLLKDRVALTLFLAQTCLVSLPVISSLARAETAQAAPDQGPVFKLSADQLANLQATDTLPEQDSAPASEAPQPVTASQLAEVLGVSEETVILLEPNQVRTSVTRYETEEAYFAALAADQAVAAASQSHIEVQQADGTMVWQEVPRRVHAERAPLRVAANECSIEAYADDGHIGAGSTFTEVEYDIAPSGTKIFHDGVENPTGPLVMIQLNSETFNPQDTDNTQRVIRLYTKGADVVPGGATTVVMQVVTENGTMFNYGFAGVPAAESFATGWLRHEYRVTLPKSYGKKTNKISFVVSVVKGPNSQVYLIDAMYTFACEVGVYLPNVSTPDKAPDVFAEKIRNGWLAFRKQNATETNEAFKARVAQEYGINVGDYGAITDVTENWIAVNPNTVYYQVNTTDGSPIKLEFSDAKVKHAALLTSAGDTMGAQMLGFIPLTGVSAIAQVPEFLAKVTMDVAGQKTAGYLVNAGKLISRVGTVGGAMTIFVWNSFYEAPFTMWDATHPEYLILHREGKQAGMVSIAPGTKSLADIEKLITGALPAATYIAKSELLKYLTPAEATELQKQAWYTVAGRWLIFDKTTLDQKSIPSLPASTTILRNEVTSAGSLEEIVATEYLYHPTVVPAGFAEHTAFVQNEYTQLIQTMATAFTVAGFDAHSALTQALYPANERSLAANAGRYFRGNPTTETRDFVADINLSMQQLLHLSAVTEEAIEILLSKSSTDHQETQKIQEQVAILFGHLQLVQKRITDSNGSYFVGKELEAYKQAHFTLATTHTRTPGQEISLGYLTDDVNPDTGQFGMKRGEAYFTAATASLIKMTNLLLDPKIKNKNLAVTRTLDTHNQLTFKPVLTELPSAGDVDSLSDADAVKLLSAVNRQISKLADQQYNNEKLTDAVVSSPFVQPTTKARQKALLEASKQKITEALVPLKEVQRKIEDKLNGTAKAFAVTNYTASFQEFFGTNTTARLLQQTEYLTADFLSQLELKSATSTASYEQLQTLVNTHLSAWHAFLKDNQLPSSATINAAGSDFYVPPQDVHAVPRTKLGSIWRFETSILENTAGLYMTASTFATQKAALTVDNGDVLGIIELSNGVTIYMLNATKTSIGTLDGVLGLGAPGDKKPLSLYSFREALARKARDLTTAPTEPQVNELDDDELWAELLKESGIDFSPLDRPTPTPGSPRRPPPPILDFERINREDGCYDPLDTAHAIDLMKRYYMTHFNEMFGGSDADVEAVFKDHLYVEDRYDSSLPHRSAEAFSSGIILLFLSELSVDPQQPASSEKLHYLGSVQYVCSDTDQADQPTSADYWEYVDNLSRLELILYDIDPETAVERYLKEVRRRYKYGYQQ